MANLVDPANLEDFLLAVVVLLKNIAASMVESSAAILDGEADAPLGHRVIRVHESLLNMNTIFASVLQDFWLTHARTVLDNELGFWVLPRSTTWFSQFLLYKYDDRRWVTNFRFTKDAMFQMTTLLALHCQKKDTKYQKAIPMRVRVAYAIYKLVHGASLLICLELFAMGKSTVSAILRDVVHAVTTEFRSEISFPRGPWFNTIMSEFHDFCGLLRVAGAIDGTHIHICKPFLGLEDYFFFKTSGYSIQMQAVINRRKKFLDVAVGMHGSIHDSRMLRRSSLYQQAEKGTLLDPAVSFEGFIPYLLGDAGYPLK
jgi:hypothetical protein